MKMITEVGSFVETSAKDFADVDDNAVCILKTESGIIGTLAASWAYVSKEDNSTIIYGEKAILRLEDDPTPFPCCSICQRGSRQI